uniref:Uncharacterized protein n=1 Tax=Ditylum brightwellii TaxID=49249 RepID=A0A7S4RR65_9STRA
MIRHDTESPEKSPPHGECYYQSHHSDRKHGMNNAFYANENDGGGNKRNNDEFVNAASDTDSPRKPSKRTKMNHFLNDSPRIDHSDFDTDFYPRQKVIPTEGYPQMDQLPEQTSSFDYRSENDSQQVSAEPRSNFQHLRQQEFNSHHQDQAIHPHGYGAYSSNYQMSSNATNMTNAARSDVPQAVSHTVANYRPDVLSRIDRVVTPPTPGQYYGQAPNSYYPSSPMAPAWQQYNKMMATHPNPPHHHQYYSHSNPNAMYQQQYSHGSHPSPYTDYHMHSGSNNYSQNAHSRFAQLPPPPLYSSHASYANHDNYPADYHHHQLSNHLALNTLRSSHCFSLATEEDKNWLSEFLCFVRTNCIEALCASQEDVSARLGSKKVKLNQVGIRCRFCVNCPDRRKARRSSTFPSSLSRIYQSLTMMLRDHFMNCSSMPDEEKEAYSLLRSNTSQGIVGSKDYWVTSAKSRGLIDTPEGIFLDDGRNEERTID